MRRFLLTVSTMTGMTALGAGLSLAPLSAFAESSASKPCAACIAELEKVLADPRRDTDRPRDKYRHPAETLAFFQVEPGMTVVDYMPSGGWYTKVLVPYLGEQGTYVGMAIDASHAPEMMRKMIGDYKNKIQTDFADLKGPGMAKIVGFNVNEFPEELTGKVDRVLDFREFHNQSRLGSLYGDMMLIRKMLKPGGMLGIVDHRAKEDDPWSKTFGNTGYVRQSDVIAVMDYFGFDLVGQSEINANPKDTKDYPDGVWMLPPGYRNAKTDADKAKVDAIGESDRMTLLFRKRD